jgi:hypothetical protein
MQAAAIISSAKNEVEYIGRRRHAPETRKKT